MPIQKRVNKNFFKKWSPQMAYVLGFFFADGTFDISSRGAYYFGFHICDKALIESIKKALKSDHVIAKRVVRKNESPRYRLQIGSKEMCMDLMQLKIMPQKTKRMVLPKIPSNCVTHFVRGYFDGDGHVWRGVIHKTRRTPHTVLQVGFTSCSQSFLYDLYAVLQRAGLRGGGVYCKKNAFCIKYSTTDSIRLYHMMYGEVGDTSLFLERKKKVFEEFLNEKREIT